MINKKDLIKEIKKQYKNFSKKEDDKLYFKFFGYPFNFLGFVENQDLSKEVLNYFCYKNEYGIIRGYNWVKGNDRLKELIKEVLK